MGTRLSDVVTFRGDRLFNGAVNIDWFLENRDKSAKAAEAFVFHGPSYHGVSQEDIGESHGHRLQDTASFTRAILRRCFGLEDAPFTLAIAGYGTGKSHLAVTLAHLLSDPLSEPAEFALKSLDAADLAIGREVRSLLATESRPCLVVALNGMRNFDLNAEVSRQTHAQLRANDLDTKPLDELRPRFMQALNLVRLSNDKVLGDLLQECSSDTIEELLGALDRQDETTYQEVHEFFQRRGMPIRVLGGESLKDIIETVARLYCGEGKPFSRLVFLFDEFGRYTEFATNRSQIAGSGVLQDLFEGIQSHSETVTFVGFIQFELNAYVQRVAPEYRNEILRYVTRFQSSSRSYLSINLETLIAHLIEKRDPERLERLFDSPQAKAKSKSILANLHLSFPQSENYALWSDPERFHKVVRKGCWPLSGYSTWLLFHLSTGGKHLQERSALALLSTVFEHYSGVELDGEEDWSLVPVDLWSEDLKQELLSSEETGQEGSVAHAYSSVEARHGAQLSREGRRILRAVVLTSKLGLRAINREGVVRTLGEFAGLSTAEAQQAIQTLEEEFNVLEWDHALKKFEIIGDAVPRSQFLAFLNQRVAGSFDEQSKVGLFALRVQDYCESLRDLDCDFSEKYQVTTREWRYQAVTTTLDNLATNLAFALDRWKNAVAVDEPRGTAIFCLVERSRNPETATAAARKSLKSLVSGRNGTRFPVFIVMIFDEDGKIGDLLAQLEVLRDSLTEEQKARFGNLVDAQKMKDRELLVSHVDSQLRKRQYISPLGDDAGGGRLAQMATSVFEAIYKKPIPFPFDGFATARGNAADSCLQLTTELFQGKLDYDVVLAKPVKVKNRAVSVLKDAWGIFTRDGNVANKPVLDRARAAYQLWDHALKTGEQRLGISSALREVCNPPFGANLASAGLLLSSYVAPRVEKLLVARGGRQLSVSEWLQTSPFRGKFLDLDAISQDELVFLGEGSSEWEELIEAWEETETYLEQEQFLNKADQLKRRRPVPPSLGYRLVTLEQVARKACERLEQNEAQHSAALEKIEAGQTRGDVGLIIWGGAQLAELRNRMANEGSSWDEGQIDKLEPQILRARQTIILAFPEWLSRQRPKGEGIDQIGEFKHKMLDRTGRNLKALELPDQLVLLEKRVDFLIKNAQTAADAHDLLRQVQMLLDQQGAVSRITRITEIRRYREMVKSLSGKVLGMARRIDLPEVVTAREALSKFQSQLSATESEMLKRAQKLWKQSIKSPEDIQTLSDEIDDLIRVFEGSESDLEDLRLMRRALNSFSHAAAELASESLTWVEFESLSKRLAKAAVEDFADGELPWAPDETVTTFAAVEERSRKDKSQSWIEQVEAESAKDVELEVAEANRLYEKAQRPPAWLTDPHRARLEKVKNSISNQLQALEVEWLLERFQGLPPNAKRRFLKLASELPP